MTFIKLKDVKKELYQHLSPEMSKRGFVTKKTENRFIKKFAKGFQAIHLVMIYGGIDVYVTLDFGIRFDEVDALINKHRRDLEDKYKKNSMTLNVYLPNLCRKSIGWTIAGSLDAEVAAKGIIETIDTIVLPELETHSNLQACLRTFSGEGSDSTPYAPLDDWCAITAIAIAFVIGDKKQFLDIANMKRTYLLSRLESGAK